jgi:Tfp pilus assembly protein PilN
VLEELSEALPQYTWLTRVTQTSPVPSVVVQDSASGPAARRMEQLAEAATAAVNKLQLRVVGQTVDIQAMTLYMRRLEASPFIENVTLVESTASQSEGRDVTQFTLDMQFQRPDPSAIRTVPLTIAVR